MNRRHFSKTLVSGFGLTAAAPATDFLPENWASTARRLKMKKPNRLVPGMTIGLIAPAGPVSEEKIVKALANMAALGFQVKPGQHIATRTGYLAGSDDDRLADLHAAFADPEVDAVWCVRGGYGTTRLLQRIDFQLIKSNPKPFIGYSDITALHTAIHQKTGLVTFHGPVGASDFTDFTMDCLKRVLISPTPRFEIRLPDASQPMPDTTFQPEILARGVARGRLIGGNLSLLAAMAGGRWQADFAKKIVFIEEIDEKPYRCDRMFTQLIDSLALKKAAGIAIGIFKGCEKGEKDENSFTLREMLRDRLGNLGIPAVYGLPFGHVSDQATLPVGILAELDADRGVLTLLETGVF